MGISREAWIKMACDERLRQAESRRSRQGFLKVFVKGKRSMSQQNVRKRICELREEIENLIDYLDLLEARAANIGKTRYRTKQVKKILAMK